MRKSIAIGLLLVCLLGLTGCGGNVKHVRIPAYASERYSDAEIQSAMDVTMDYFRKEFDGCTLTELTYIGDDKLEDWSGFARRNRADDVMVLVSSFEVGASGGDGSLNPHDTYRNWKWILVRTGGGNWVHVDHGY